MMKYLFCGLMGLATCVSAQDEPPSARFSNRITPPDANSNLPPQVEAASGKLTLFADFKNPGEEGIPLYLVNRTDKPILMENQDSDGYVKLEIRNASGQWERAQAHSYSDCGNSYGSDSLLPGMYLRMRGYQPAGGQPAKIRYSGYKSQDLVSNVGEGFYKPEDVSDSRFDRMSFVGVPGTIVKYFETGWLKMLEVPNPSTRVAALKMASLMGEIPAIRKEAGKWADELKALENPTPDQRAALSAVGEVLAADWGGSAGTRRLLESCYVAVKFDAGSAAAFGTLEKERVLTLNVLRDIAKMENSYRDVSKSDVSLWKSLFDSVTSRAKTSPEVEADLLAQILGAPSLADEFVSDRSFEDLLDAKNRWVAKAAAEALSRRAKWERLAELGFQLDPEHQLIVLGALGRGAGYVENMGWSAPYREPASGDGLEKKFWIHVFTTQPVKAASALRSSWLYEHGPSRVERSGYYKPLMEFWDREIQRSDQADQDFELSSDGIDYRFSTQFITADPRKEDIPFLRGLLRYRGYEKSTGGSQVEGLQGMREWEFRSFRVRAEAGEALKKLGESVPHDTLFETRILTGAVYEEK